MDRAPLMVEQVRGWMTHGGIMFAVITEWKVTTRRTPVKRRTRRVVIPPLDDFSGVMRGYVLQNVPGAGDTPAEMVLIGAEMDAWHGPAFVDARNLRSRRFRATFLPAGAWRRVKR